MSGADRFFGRNENGFSHVECVEKVVVDGSFSDAELSKVYEAEFGGEVAPVLGEDWRDKVYSAKEQLVDAFVEYDKDWFLVAHGAKKDDKCGSFMSRKIKGLMACLCVENHAGIHVDGVDYTNKVSVRRYFYSCNRPECPSCGVSGWAVKEAAAAEARLKYIQVRFGVRFEHIVLSPPQDLGLSPEDLRKYVLKAALKRGIVGGLYAYHHFRYHGKNESFVGEKAHYFKGVHFHFVAVIKDGYGNCRSCSHKKIEDFDYCRKHCNGWEAVTRRCNEKDGVIAEVFGERKSLGGTVWYELTHASLRRGVEKHVVVNWFGAYGRNKLRIPKGSMPQKECLCEICGEPLVRVGYNGDYADLLRYMSGFKDGKVFVLDYKDADGKPLWFEVHDGRG